MIQNCVWGCPDLHSIDVIDFVALKPLLLAAAEMLLLFWHVVLFWVLFYTNGGDILPAVSNSERPARLHCLGGLWKQKLLEHPSLPSNGLSRRCIPSGDKALSLSLTSQFAGGFLGRHGGGHMLQWESLLNWACVSSCAGTFWSSICVCLLTWGKNARTLEKPWIFGVGVVLFVFLVVQKCPNALVGIYSQNRSWF